jgi:hypothetical protein
MCLRSLSVIPCAESRTPTETADSGPKLVQSKRAPWAFRKAAHGIDRIAYQIQYNLLKLRVIGEYERNVLLAAHGNGYSVCEKIVLREFHYFPTYIVEVNLSLFVGQLSKESDNTAHDLVGPAASIDHGSKTRSRPFDIGRAGLKPIKTSSAGTGDTCQRLSNFMRHRGCGCLDAGDPLSAFATQ